MEVTGAGVIAAGCAARVWASGLPWWRRHIGPPEAGRPLLGEVKRVAKPGGEDGDTLCRCVGGVVASGGGGARLGDGGEAWKTVGRTALPVAAP